MSSMKKIAIDGRELRTSTGRVVERLLHYLQAIDHKHEYIVLLKPKDFDGWEPTNPNFKKVKCPYKEFTFGEQLGMLRQIRGLKPDLVHFFMPQQPVLYRGKTVTNIHDLTTTRWRNPVINPLIFTVKQQIYKRLIKRVARKSTRLLAISEFTRDDVVDFTGVDPGKITITYPAADKIKDHPKPIKNLEGKKFITYVGRPLPHKNLWRLVRAYALLKQTHPDLLLVLAGKYDDGYRLLAGQAKQAGITGVVFTDFITDAQLRWLYENAAAYVFPSLSEGFGLPGLEAMLYGLPVASSSATCLPEIYQDAPLYFDPNSVEEMAEKISMILDNPILAAELAKRGKKQAAKYSWKRLAQQTLKVYEETLGE